MKKFLLAMFAVAAALTAQAEIVLARGGKSDYTIIYDAKTPDVLVDPAVRDLAETLREITGAEFPIKAQAAAEGPKIHIGVTPPGDKDDFASRERRIKSVGSDLYIYGDRRYGTAGAIYNFLRDF